MGKPDKTEADSALTTAIAALSRAVTEQPRESATSRDHDRIVRLIRVLLEDAAGFGTSALGKPHAIQSYFMAAGLAVGIGALPIESLLDQVAVRIRTRVLAN